MDIEIDILSHIIKNRQYTTIIQLRKANRSKTKGSCARNEHKGLIYPSTKSPPDCVPGGALQLVRGTLATCPPSTTKLA
jgi:hypothetical protein